MESTLLVLPEPAGS